ncbi:MAG: prolipoprotein diacylglyceryl transferase [Clostridia bacterium]|nr:prolipoprotein diacylglyceryl transferase [Clostridia bacterium]
MPEFETLVRFGGIAKEFYVTNVLDLGFTSVRWYGAIIAFGFTLAVLFGGRRAYVWKINLDKMIDVLLYGTVAAIIGARLYYVAFEWDYYKNNLSEIFQIWEGGLAIYGGIIGGLIAAFIVCKVEKLNFYNLLDMVGMSLLIGQGIGRWGNYANQEAFGVLTNNPKWGMMSDVIAEKIAENPSVYGLEGIDNIPEYIAQNDLYVHPTFFYESVWCILGFFVLYIILKKYRKFSGQLFLTYGVWYGLERMIVEGMRTDSLYIGSTTIRVSQLLSMLIVVVCGALLIVLLAKYKKNPKPIEGVDYFPPKTEKEIAAEKKKAEKKALKAQKKQYKIVDGKPVLKSKEDKKSIEPSFDENESSESNDEADEEETDRETILDDENDERYFRERKTADKEV